MSGHIKHWGFFAGFCAWFPGVLVMLSTTDIILSLIQGIGTQAYGAHANWLTEPWQQGLIVLFLLLIVGLFSTMPLPWMMKIARGVILAYGIGIFMVGMAGVIWLLSGHSPQVSLTTSTLGLHGQN